MIHRACIAAGLGAVLASSACSTHDAPSDTPPPNVLVVLIDTLRADRLGAYGSERGLTPALDRLAEESLLFAECWSTSSWTLPSIATIFTSNHGAQHGAWLADVRLGSGIDTLAEHFADEDYRTGAVTGGGWVRREFGLDRGFDSFVDEVEPLDDAVALTREWIRDAAARVGGPGDGPVRPWFFFLHTYAVHAPYEPPEADIQAVRNRYPGLLEDRALDPLAFQDVVAENGGRVPDDVAEALELLYDAEVRDADRILGQLFDDLRADGTLDDTLVVVTSDHGEEFGEHGLLGHSDTLYAEQLWVPWILRFPGARRAGEVDRRPVSQLDLAPTVLDAAGLGPRIGGSTFEGRSVLSGEPSAIYATRNHEDAGLLRSVREGGWVWFEGAYRWARGTDGSELYHSAQDPFQQRECRHEHAVDAQRLRSKLDELTTRFGRSRADSKRVEVDDETRKKLEALGYHE